MKFIVLLCLFLTGCQTAAPLPRPAAATTPVAAPNPPVPSSVVKTDETIRHAQVVEALLSQIEALQARVKALPASTPASPVSATPPSGETAPISAPVPSLPENVLVPNADHVIDLAAAQATAEGEPVNPFTVRAPGEGGKELVLTIQGMVTGDRPFAVVNDAVLSAGDTIGALTVLRIEPEAVYFKGLSAVIKVPAGEAVKVRGL